MAKKKKYQKHSKGEVEIVKDWGTVWINGETCRCKLNPGVDAIEGLFLMTAAVNQYREMKNRRRK